MATWPPGGETNRCPTKRSIANPIVLVLRTVASPPQGPCACVQVCVSSCDLGGDVSSWRRIVARLLAAGLACWKRLESIESNVSVDGQKSDKTEVHCKKFLPRSLSESIAVGFGKGVRGASESQVLHDICVVPVQSKGLPSHWIAAMVFPGPRYGLRSLLLAFVTRRNHYHAH